MGKGKVQRLREKALPGPFKCNMCTNSRVFDSLSALEDHVKDIHHDCYLCAVKSCSVVVLNAAHAQHNHGLNYPLFIAAHKKPEESDESDEESGVDESEEHGDDSEEE